jgi:beta-N-acetylhexosaminidase
MSLPFILGCSRSELTKDEKIFFNDTQPFGFILFQRNCVSKTQVQELVYNLRESVNHFAPIFIDQEGGRVQRLKEPVWRQAPTSASFGKIFEVNEELATQLVFQNARLIAEELQVLGIDVNCAPVLDLLESNASDIIGDRAFSSNPYATSTLARSFVKGLENGGVAPVVKHIPGHGRAKVDSHLALPKIDTELTELKKRDFIPFVRLNDSAAAMTGHLLLDKIDSRKPVTISSHVIDSVIRKYIGFQGLLISDDISMAALTGDLSLTTKKVFEAGCDIVLHCNGKLDEMKKIIDKNQEFGVASKRRADKFLIKLTDLKKQRKAIDYRTVLNSFNQSFGESR